jgi:hypothetical protein
MWRIMSMWVWVVIIAALLFICFRGVYKIAYERGFHAGATRVLNEWKQYMKTEDKL